MRGPEEEQRSFFESFEKKKGEKESFGFERRDSYSRGVGEGGGGLLEEIQGKERVIF